MTRLSWNEIKTRALAFSLDTVPILQGLFDVAGRHPLGLQGQDFILLRVAPPQSDHRPICSAKTGCR